MNDLERIRSSAVGLKVDQEMLELFSAGKEESIQIPGRNGDVHVFVYYPKQEQETYPFFHLLSPSWLDSFYWGQAYYTRSWGYLQFAKTHTVGRAKSGD